jgi:hypothetical protein
VVAAARPTPWYVRAARVVLMPWPVKLPLGVAAILLVGGLAVLMFRSTEEQQRAARQTLPPLADRSVTAERTVPDRAPAKSVETKSAEPAAPPTTARGEAASSDRAAGAVAQSAPGERRETSAAAKLEAPRAMSTPTTPPDVVARLVAPERDTAERALAALAARLAGAQTGRRVAGDALVVELAIPRERYRDFTREVTRLGDYRTESEPPTLPDTVRIAVHLGV